MMERWIAPSGAPATTRAKEWEEEKITNEGTHPKYALRSCSVMLGSEGHTRSSIKSLNQRGK